MSYKMSFEMSPSWETRTEEEKEKSDRSLFESLRGEYCKEVDPVIEAVRTAYEVGRRNDGLAGALSFTIDDVRTHLYSSLPNLLGETKEEIIVSDEEIRRVAKKKLHYNLPKF